MNSKSLVVLCIILTAGIFSNTMVVSAAEPQEIKVTVDGNPVTFDQKPQIINGNVMIPIKAVAEMMGWEVRQTSPNVIELAKAVKYTDGTRDYLFSCNKITIDLDYERIDRSIAVGVGRFFDTAADKKISFTLNPVVVNGSTLVHMNDIGKCLYAEVEWSGTTQTVSIKSGAIPYYDGQGLENRDELFEQMRNYYKISGTLTKIGNETAAKTAKISQTTNLPFEPTGFLTEAPKVGSIPANILLPGKTDVKSKDSYYEPYKININAGCNWYAYGRLYETTGIWILSTYQYGTRGKLHELESANLETVRVERNIEKIKYGCIAIFVGKTNKDTGHAIFVEYVEYDTNGKPVNVYYTDSNRSKTGYFDPSRDAKIIKVSFEKFKKLYQTKVFDGFIVPAQ